MVPTNHHHLANSLAAADFFWRWHESSLHNACYTSPAASEMVASVESSNKAWRGPHEIHHLGRVGLGMYGVRLKS
jgi:alanine racemase